MMGNDGISVADALALRNGGDGFGGDSFGAWWIIILILLFAGGGWGRGGYGSDAGAAQNYVLASDFATLQRQMSDGFNTVERRTDSITNGICDLGYTNQSLINTVNTNILQNGNGIMNAINQCCCNTREAIAGVNYNMATGNNTISREIERGFCDTNFNNQTAHAQTMQAIDRVGDRVIDWLAADKAQALRDENQALRLAASQAAQNQYLVNQLRPMPQPAYLTCNPFTGQTYNGCGCNTCC